MRTRTISRTINEVVAKAVVYDGTQGTIAEKEYTLTGKMKIEEALKYLKKNYETIDYKIVTVKELTTVEQLYIMTEEDFIKYAKKADKRYLTK